MMIDDNKKEAVADEEKVEEAVANLSIQDLILIRDIINIASQRGTFKPEEFTVVGNSYNKLNSFIATVKPQLEEAQAAAKVAEEG